MWGFLAWFDGGFGTGALAIGGILSLGLVLVAPGQPWRRLPAQRGASRIAIVAACLLLLWTFLSISWAHYRSDAWVGADKTLLAVTTFLLFSFWPLGRDALIKVLGAFVLVLTAVAVGVAVKAIHAPDSVFTDGRLSAPTGYINATVALWMLGFWPACYLGSLRRLSPAARAIFLAAAALFLDLAVLGQSRSWAFLSAPLAILFVFLSRRPLRMVIVFAIVVAGATWCWPTLFDVYARVSQGRPISDTLPRTLLTILASCAVTALLGVAWSYAERRVSVSEQTQTRIRVALIAVGVVLALVGAASRGLTHPRTWVTREWNDFTQGTTTPSGDNRFQTLGSDRYLEWRIAWSGFKHDPVLGIGAENYGDLYLLERPDSLREPAYPHSIPLGLLVGLGAVGLGLAVVLIAAAGRAAFRWRSRLDDPTHADGVVAALMIPLYWLAHGTFDWFWEFPALAAPAFAMLGVVVSAGSSESPSTGGPIRRLSPRGVTVAVGVAACALAVSFALPALSDAYVNAASASWRANPGRAFSLLRRAAWLNPLAGDPYVIEGAIATRVGDSRRAVHAYDLAAKREPRNWYAKLEFALLSERLGNHRTATQAMSEAQRLNPRDPVVLYAAAMLRSGHSVDTSVIDRLYLNEVKRRFPQAPGG
ncbi:MAG: O-antigen ligase family protein [Gaiellaceae bacterium]